MSNLTNDVKARVLNAVSAIDPIVTNASNRTANYELPLFIGSDKPAWLVDWNNTMVALDTLMKEVESVGTDNTTVIVQIQTKLADLEKVVQTAQSDITANSNNITENANNIKELTNSMNTVQDDLISQNSVIKTHTTQIADLQATDETQNTDITQLKTDVQTADGKADNAQTDATNITNNFNSYVAEKSRYQFIPFANIKSAKVPLITAQESEIISFNLIPINGITGKGGAYGLIIFQMQNAGATIYNLTTNPVIVPFVVDENTVPFLINSEGEQVTRDLIIRFSDPVCSFNLSVDKSAIENSFSITFGSQSVSTGQGYNILGTVILFA